MIKPKPIIRLDNIDDQESLIRALYALGFQFNDLPDPDAGVASWRGYMGTDVKRSRYPWITLDENGINGYAERSHCDPGTLINSPRQFLVYASTLSS